MFTGIIKDIGTVQSIEKSGDWRARIQTALDLTRMEIGASAACSGVCLTAVQKGSDWFDVDISQETLSKTNISHWKTGHKINLEPSLRIGDELGGHFVYGHVDKVVEIADIKESGDSYIFYIMQTKGGSGFTSPSQREVAGGEGTVSGITRKTGTPHPPSPSGLRRTGPNHLPMGEGTFLIVPKGSVTLDGVALTVNDVEKDYFTINVIPHTLAHTTLGERRAGDLLNLEYDMLARYVAKMIENAA